MKTPRVTSPYNYFQERFRDDPWALLVSVIMLNQTNGKQVEQVYKRFFACWPTYAHVYPSHEPAIADVIRPLGFYNRRARTIVKLAGHMVSYAIEVGDIMNAKSVVGWPGCGRYAQDSWNIFVRGIIPDGTHEVADKELRRYIAWAKEQANGA